jgi:hypothetical protein
LVRLSISELGALWRGFGGGAGGGSNALVVGAVLGDGFRVFVLGASSFKGAWRSMGVTSLVRYSQRALSSSDILSLSLIVFPVLSDNYITSFPHSTKSSFYMFYRSLFCLCLCFALLVAVPMHARSMVEVEIADSEKPVFAFFKLARYAPDFEYWAESIQPGSHVRTQEEIAVFREQEATRLQWGFGTYDETVEFLPLRIPVDLMMVEKDGKHLIYYNLVGFQAGELPFFPFPYGEQAIGLLLKDLKKFDGVELAQGDYDRVKGHFVDGEPLRASLRMRVRPLKAEVGAPSVVDSINFWMLSGDVGYFSYELPKVGGGYERLMSYSAPWFMTPSELELFELLGE